jgi:hypothetical protein
MIYTELKEKYSAAYQKLVGQYNIISALRLILVISFLIAAYNYLDGFGIVWLSVFLASLGAFIYLLIVHEKTGRKRDLFKALTDVNKNEALFLQREFVAFEDGIEFSEENHPYAYDIDILGQHSLFQHLNRCGTYPGKKRLAERLKSGLSTNEIQKNQEAVMELSHQLDFRQKMLAVASMKKDNQKLFENILKWSELPNPPFSIFIRILSFVMPLVFFSNLIFYLITFNDISANLITYLFLANLALLYSQLKKIQQQILSADKVRNVMRQYGLIITEIENLNVNCDKLKALQHKLKNEKTDSGIALQKLSALFNSLEAIQNFLGAVIFNGLFLYHLHVLYAIIKWKEDNANKIKEWLDVIAEMEMLNSFANFSYNNPTFAFPELNSSYELSFENMGHPLLDPNKRVDNTVNFSNKPFIILTGSNMSGKSTFLRSIGVNMVLAAAGSVVCAEKAKIHPMKLYVSMRLSDSLADSESYFYAEIKRLHEIMAHLDHERAFVLLDEILRGTNSDDKRNGTIGVVKKLIDKKAFGAIATHDLEVCNTTSEFPDYLSNKCFEVEIKEDNLNFDYKLKEGISQNKSASFLMEKMGII